ncbi:MAG: helix-turn-helix domain-containing protein [Bdellovibrionales bacterium]|nr:helix-turn-helix domain-containing protein [Bdellovibrionales bacterium]
MSSKQALHQSLGNYLKNKRNETGLTQSEVATKLGYSSPQFISNFERGLCSPPLKNLKTLVKLYKIPVEEIMTLILEEQESILRKALSGAGKRKRKAK